MDDWPARAYPFVDEIGAFVAATRVHEYHFMWAESLFGKSLQQVRQILTLVVVRHYDGDLLLRTSHVQSARNRLNQAIVWSRPSLKFVDGFQPKSFCTMS